MQFSTFDFQVEAMKLTDRAGNVTDIQHLNDVVIDWDTMSLEVLYQLIGPQLNDADLPQLNRVTGPRELAFSVGGTTYDSTLGVNGELTFTDFQAMMNAFNSADPGEALTLRLAQTSDPDNVLWEYAFVSLAMAVDANRDRQIEFNGNDATTAELPLKFWINNDFDATADGVQQDFNPSLIQDFNDEKIYVRRDVEDFSGIRIALPATPGNDFSVWLQGGPSLKIRVFGGAWNESLDYVASDASAEAQRAKPPLFVLENGVPVQIPADQFVEGEVKLVFEGLANTAGVNGESLKVFIMNKAKRVVETDVFIKLRDIAMLYPHYTVGDSANQEVEPVAHEINGYQYPGLALPGHEEEFILFVHGWRLQPWERRAFAETAFKRLYWQGYKGQYGFYSWPTEWVGDSNIGKMLDPLNYDRSEVKARKAGLPLMTLLSTGALARYKGNIRVFAHSMGNVVVSEALRAYQGGGPLMDAYVASQAASDGDSYLDAPEMTYPLASIGDAKPDWLEVSLPANIAWSVATSIPSFNTTWELFNAGAMPPDRYSTSAIPSPRPSNVPDYSWGNRYFSGVGGKAGAIVNFNNIDDYALEGWEANQVLKPDGASKPTNDYSWSYALETQPASWGQEYRDHYYRDSLLGAQEEIVWSPEISLTGIGTAEILAHIIPARSVALGAYTGAGGEIQQQNDLNGAPYSFDRGEYEHSAQFHETSARRWCYWEAMMIQFDYKEGAPLCQ